MRLPRLPLRWLLLSSPLVALGSGACEQPRDTAVDTGIAASESHPWLVDEQGRTVLHRGINVVHGAKSAEDHLPELTDDEWAVLQGAGFTLARVLVFWEGVEPERGEIDHEYLDGVDGLLDRFDELGLDVMVDMHQDLWGEGFGSAGAPAWTCDESNYETYENTGDYWWMGYFTEEMANCFEGLWSDTDLQDHYAAAWAEVAAVAREHPSVVGYDLMNEPFFARRTWEEMEEQTLPDFYSRVLSALRAVDDERGSDGRFLRFAALEPSAFTNLYQSTLLRFPDEERLVFAPHFYPGYAETGTGWDGDFESEAENLQDLVAHAAEQGIPTLVGEYGIFSAEGNEHDYVRAVQDTVESALGSTCYWSFDRGSEHGVLDENGEPGFMMPAFERPFFHRIPGRVTAVSATPTGMTLTYEPEGEADLEASVPLACGTPQVTGAQLREQEGTRWYLEPDARSGTLEVSIEGCASR